MLRLLRASTGQSTKSSTCAMKETSATCAKLLDTEREVASGMGTGERAKKG